MKRVMKKFIVNVTAGLLVAVPIIVSAKSYSQTTNTPLLSKTSVEIETDKEPIHIKGNEIYVRNNEPITDLASDNFIEDLTDDKDNEDDLAKEFDSDIDLQNGYDKDDLDQQQYDSLALQTYRICCNLSLLNTQLEYQDSVIEELQKRLEIEKAKLAKGYSTNIAVKDLMAQIHTANAQNSSLIEKKRLMENRIEAKGKSFEDTILDEEVELQDYDYQTLFSENSVQKKKIEDLINNYIKYLEDEKISDENRKIITNQLEEERLKLEDYKIELSLYVDEMITNYRTLKEEILAKEEEIAVQAEKIEINSKLYNQGVIQQVDVTNSNTILKKLEYEKKQMVTQVQIIVYILEHQIENETIQ